MHGSGAMQNAGYPNTRLREKPKSSKDQAFRVVPRAWSFCFSHEVLFAVFVLLFATLVRRVVACVVLRWRSCFPFENVRVSPRLLKLAE